MLCRIFGKHLTSRRKFHQILLAGGLMERGHGPYCLPDPPPLPSTTTTPRLEDRVKTLPQLNKLLIE